MANAQNWKREREQYQAAWAKYQNVAERIDAKYESLDSGIKDQAPAEEDLSELQEAWKELENARERLVSITMSSMSGIWPKVKACDFVEQDRAILRKR